MKISRITCFALLVHCLFLLSAALPLKAQTDNPVDPSTQEVYTTEVGTFRYRDKIYRLWVSVNNAVRENPVQWQFRYDPLFIVETDSSGLFAPQLVQFGDTWRTRFKILLDTDIAAVTAYTALQIFYPEQADSILPDNVLAKPIPSIRIKIPQLEREYPNSSLINSSYNFSTPERSFLIEIESSTEEEARAVASSLYGYLIEYEFSTSHFLSRRNRVEIDLRSLQNSKLIAELNGMGSNEVYVHRTDLRNLLEEIQEEYVINEYIEDPENFRQEFLEQLIDRYFDRVDTSQSTFDEQKWQSTYHADDLRPDVIAKELNRIFVRNKEENRWVRSGDIGGEISLDSGIFRFLGLGFSLNRAYTEEEIERKMREAEISVAFEGQKIIVKSVQVYRTNLSELINDNRGLIMQTIVEVGGINVTQGQINLAAFVDAEESIYSELQERIQGLQEEINLLPEQTTVAPVDRLTATRIATATALLPVTPIPATSNTPTQTATSTPTPTQVPTARKTLKPSELTATAAVATAEAYQQLSTWTPTATPTPTPTPTATHTPDATATYAIRVSTIMDRANAVNIDPATIKIDPVIGAAFVKLPSPKGESETESLTEFWIMQTEVTNEQYAIYLNAIGEDTSQLGPANHPVHGLSIAAANAFASWFSEMASLNASIPTDEQWRYACSGPYGWEYSGGNEADGRNPYLSNLTVSDETTYCYEKGWFSCLKYAFVTEWSAHTDPVAQELSRASYYGVLDMDGNVWEWTTSGTQKGGTTYDTRESNFTDYVQNEPYATAYASCFDTPQVDHSNDYRIDEFKGGLRLVIMDVDW